MNTKNMVPFEVGEQVVYPQYGLGDVVQIVEKQIGEIRAHFYRVKFSVQQVEILIPVNTAFEKGLRKIMCEEETECVLDSLSSPVKPMSAMLWRRWRKETQRHIKSSNPIELAKIYRHLVSMVEDQRKEISFTERKILSQIEQILCGEISACKEISQEDALVLMKDHVAASRPSAHPMREAVAE